jgi:hypothetical protein
VKNVFANGNTDFSENTDRNDCATLNENRWRISNYDFPVPIGIFLCAVKKEDLCRGSGFAAHYGDADRKDCATLNETVRRFRFIQFQSEFLCGSEKKRATRWGKRVAGGILRPDV